MKNKSFSKKYKALTEFMNSINKECNVFQDNPECEPTPNNNMNTLKKYYETYSYNLRGLLNEKS